MKSIRNKLFIGISFILSFFILGILIFAFTFKSYFINSKLNEIDTILSIINSYNSKDELNNNTDKLSILSEKYNLQIQVIDLNTNHSICGTGNKFNQGNMMHQKNKFQVIKSLRFDLPSSEANIVLDNSTNSEFIRIINTNESLDYLTIIMTPISAIDDTLQKSLTLLFFILIPISLLTLIATILFSRKFTNPILLINKKADDIKNLSFTDDLSINSNDEIELLSNTINNLSSNIEKYITDLTSKNSTLEDLIEKDKIQQELNKEFISSISHELKSPITVISGYAQGLDSNIISSKEDMSYYIQTIRDESYRMEVIVNDLLTLYKLQSNTFALNLIDLSLDELLTSTVNKLSFKFDELNISLELQIDKVYILGDPVRLEQVITNYINNAISHVDDKKNIKISLIQHEGKAILSIYNSGECIPNESLEKIWTGFVRLDKVRNYKENRVGLGLAIVKQIISQHNGSVGVKNLDNGVEFWFSLDIL